MTHGFGSLINKRSFQLELMCLYFWHGAQDAQVKLVHVAEQTADPPGSMYLYYDDTGHGVRSYVFSDCTSGYW